jgi:hypothetical protein
LVSQVDRALRARWLSSPKARFCIWRQLTLWPRRSVGVRACPRVTFGRHRQLRFGVVIVPL